MRLKWFIFAGLLADAILAVPTYRAIDLRRSNARTSAEVIRLGKALSLYRPDRPESYSVIGPHELGHHHVAVPADLTASVRCSPDEPCYLRAWSREDPTVYYFWNGAVYAQPKEP